MEVVDGYRQYGDGKHCRADSLLFVLTLVQYRSRFEPLVHTFGGLLTHAQVLVWFVSVFHFLTPLTPQIRIISNSSQRLSGRTRRRL